MEVGTKKRHVQKERRKLMLLCSQEKKKEDKEKDKVTDRKERIT